MRRMLIRNGQHQRPMLAVLERNELGVVDEYHRGRWIYKKDLPAILDAIRSDPEAIRIGAADWDWGCPGTNRHNCVRFSDFRELFE